MLAGGLFCLRQGGELGLGGGVVDFGFAAHRFALLGVVGSWVKNESPAVRPGSASDLGCCLSSVGNSELIARKLGMPRKWERGCRAMVRGQRVPPAGPLISVQEVSA